jgi:hypothetical protein
MAADPRFGRSVTANQEMDAGAVVARALAVPLRPQQIGIHLARMPVQRAEAVTRWESHGVGHPHTGIVGRKPLRIASNQQHVVRLSRRPDDRIRQFEAARVT